MFGLPYIPYPPSKEGYWGSVTSTINWCEEDYYATPYSAEIVNAFTNLMFMYLAYKGISSCFRYNHDTVFVVAFVGYLIVGTGSFFFHSTLKYPMQLVDELSMIYTTCIMFYASFTRNSSPLLSVLLSIALVSISVFITAYYHYLQDPVFHQVTYALLTAVLLIRSMIIMEAGIRPSNRSRSAELAILKSVTRENGSDNSNSTGNAAEGMSAAQIAELKRQDERDKEVLRTMWTMVAYGLTVFLGGFGIWALDMNYCQQFRSWRHQVGLPWGIFLEGHGWWHLMTGIGAYFYIVWGIWLRYCLNGRQDDVELVWPRFITSFPEVIVKSPQQSVHKTQSMNGGAKKEQ